MPSDAQDLESAHRRMYFGVAALNLALVFCVAEIEAPVSATSLKVVVVLSPAAVFLAAVMGYVGPREAPVRLWSEVLLNVLLGLPLWGTWISGVALLWYLYTPASWVLIVVGVFWLVVNGVSTGSNPSGTAQETAAKE